MMNPSFTREEKLFVLAEIIKASRIDVDSLVQFVRYHNIEPDWMSMQIPLGRNMKQCMQFAEHISIATPPLKRRPSSDDFEHPAKRLAFSELPEHTRPTSSPGILQPAQPPPPPPLPISAPRTGSVNGFVGTSPPSVAPVLAKKRGRPSRADKAKRDLRPLLPQHLAPRPSPSTGPPQIFSPTGSRPILPAIDSPREIRRGPLDPRPWSPPVLYRISPGREERSPEKNTEHTADAETTRPRLFPDPTANSLERISPPVLLDRPAAPVATQRASVSGTGSPSSAREMTSGREASAVVKNPMSVVSAITREVPLTNPA